MRGSNIFLSSSILVVETEKEMNFGEEKAFVFTKLIYNLHL